jgi:hypothetical protein
MALLYRRAGRLTHRNGDFRRGQYTNIGVDDRNQFQLIESQPGGVAGLRQVVEELHAAGVSALWPYNPWCAHTPTTMVQNPLSTQKS